MDKNCCNCGTAFKEKAQKKGYYRFSLESTRPQSDSVAKDILCNMTGNQFSPVSSKAQGNCMCPACWKKLSDTVKYRRTVDEFWRSTEPESYIGQKRTGQEEDPNINTFGTSTQVCSTDPACDSTFESLAITPVKVTAPARKTLFACKPSKTAKWDSIVNAVRCRKYGRAISGLFHATKASQKHFLKFIKRTIRKEVNMVIQADTMLSMDTTIPNIGMFGWNKVISQMKTQAPVLEAVLRSAITTPSNEESLKRGNSINLLPHLGIAAATLLHARAPRKIHFLQTLLSIQFWTGGLKRETIKQLAHTGICMSYDHTLIAVDKIREGFDKAAMASKEGVEKCLVMATETPNNPEEELEQSIAMAMTVPNIEEEVNPSSDIEEQVNEDDDEVSEIADDTTDEEDDVEGSDDSDDNDEKMDTAEETVVAETDTGHGGFAFCWDNVGKMVKSRNPSQTKRNTYMNMALGYMAINRVPTTGLPTAPVTKAFDMNVNCFLPCEGDFSELRKRMGIIVGRYIFRHIQWFHKHFADIPLSHILHEHSFQSSKKSVILNLDVFDENPCSTQGAIGIYERLQKYVPSTDDNPHTILVYGDGLSCERDNDTQKARSNGLTAWERLDGLEPAAQEFHKEMILLQDYHDEFFNATSSSDRGTLVQLKNLFNFRTVKADISDNFTHAWELMCMTTEGLVCLLAMELMGMDDQTSRLAKAPSQIEQCSMEEKTAYVDEVANAVVDAIWHDTDVSVLQGSPSQPPAYKFCVP